MRYLVHLDDEEWMIDSLLPHVVYCKSKSDNGWYMIVDESGEGRPTSCPCVGFSYGKCRHFMKARKHWGKWPSDGIPVGKPEEGDGWIPIEKIIGTDRIPESAAEVIAQAIAKMVRNDEVSRDAPWQALEFLAADYLGGH